MFFMLGKRMFNITLIIVINLFAFLSLWHILDAIFKTKWTMKLVFVAISIVPLTIIMYFYLKKILTDLNNIKNENRENDKK